MRTIIHTLIGLSILSILTSCGGGDTMEARKAKLEKLKAQQVELGEQIKTLESEISSNGDTTQSTEKMKDVMVTTIAPQVFEHSIDVQGRVEGDENVTIMTKMAGNLLKLNVTAGDQVKQGQVMAEIESGAMRAQLADLKTSYELAKEMYNKQKALWEQKVGTEMQYLQAKSNKESLEQKINQLNETLDMYLIKAPFNGTVDEVTIKLGQTVAPGMPAVRVVNFNKLKVRADLAEAYAAKVKTGNTVNVIFPDIDKNVVSRVTYSAKVINPMTRTFNVEVALPSSSDYRPNMVAEVHIVDYSAKEALLAPINTVQNIDDKNYVFVAIVDNGLKKARKREVTVGLTYNGVAEITGGLQTGDLLITTGYSNLNDGELIRY